MPAISEVQNRPANVDLLVAQRRLYSDAKVVRGVRVVGSALFAIPLPVISVLIPETQSLITGLGFLWLMAALVLMFAVERRNTDTATRILEQFDVEVFCLEWNRRLAGRRTSPEEIQRAIRRAGQDREQLYDWYPPVVDGVPYPLSVLICQRAGTVWDWQLKSSYGWVVAAAVVLLMTTSIAIAVAVDYSTLEWLLVLVLPMGGAFAGGADTVRRHFSDAKDQREMCERLDDDWRRALEDPSSLTVKECRQHQDCRYTHRQNGLPVPDFWYQINRKRAEADMTAAARHMVEEFADRQS